MVDTVSPLETVSGSSLGGFFGGLLDVFDKGADIYLSTQERRQALKQIANETVNSAGPIVNAPSSTETGLLASAKAALNNSAVAFILAGVLGIILLVLILKRKG